MHSADSLYAALLLDTWPDSVAAISDFGLDGDNREKIYAIMHQKVKSGEVSLDQLRSAAGDGDALSGLFGVEVLVGY